MASLVLNLSESLSVGDQVRHNAKAIISDIYVGTSDISSAQFETIFATGQPVGYDPFSTFIDGNYSYKNAVYKVVIKDAGTASEARIKSMAVSVDVPDVFDAGSINVPLAGVTVLFAKSFYIPPEITITLKGGTTFAKPRISITKNSFFVELFDGLNNPTSGLVSWAAHGY
jgi:hypothetical protein